MATKFRVLPSDVLFIENSWDAFCFNRACFMYGSTLSAELEEVDGKNKKEITRKRDQILRRWFPEAKSKQTFADPGKR